MSTDLPAGTVPAAPPSPFAGIPASDYLRDAAALVLLLLSLAMHWNVASMATGRIEVILITLLSVFSLSITYLARTGVFPPSVTVSTVWMLRLMFNAPYVTLVLVYLIIDAIVGGSGAGGVGFAAAFGLAGAILAAQPREAEVRNQPHGAAIGEVWYRIFAGFAAVVTLTSLASLILLVAQPGYGYVPVPTMVILVASVLLNLFAVIAAYGGVLRRSESARLVGLAVGFAMLGALVVDLFSGSTISSGGIESIHGVGFGSLVFAALAGLTASPALRVAMTPLDPLQRWLRAATLLLIAAASLAGFVVLLSIVVLASGSLGVSYVGFGIGTIVTVVAFALAAVVARTVLVNNPATGRTLALALVGLMLLLGTVHIVLAAIGSRVGILDLILAFGLPVAAGIYLTAPREVREYYRALSPIGAGQASTAVPTFVEQLTAPVQPIVATAPPAAPATPPTQPNRVALALDPSTSPAVLYQLAQEDAALRPYLAANPATYPDLLAWLGSLGDPAVDAALKARNAR